jgi:aspartate carbamoyltransferase catalytic subunit
MALILTVLQGNGLPAQLIKGKEHKTVECSNPKCITHRELYLPHYLEGSGDILTCEYCDCRTLI